ncbi:MAG: Factor arrest protein 11 [Vezdaea aestivalis]|nr:MAG: Factor arrest protein 11 [Vezdaea aestivalis]
MDSHYSDNPVEEPPPLEEAPRLDRPPLSEFLALPVYSTSKNFADRWAIEPEEPRPDLSAPAPEAAVDVTDIGVPSTFGSLGIDGEARPVVNEGPTTSNLERQARPPLRRLEFTRPPPGQQPPPPPAPLQPNATDSLSLLQLKKLVSDFPTTDHTAYAFSYEDAASFPEEVEEWFSYAETEKSYIWRSRVAFEQQWEKFKLRETRPGPLWSWTAAPLAVRRKFVAELVHQAELADLKKRAKALGRLVYIALGSWCETAGLKSTSIASIKLHGTPEGTFDKSTLQIKWMYDGLELIYDAMGIPVIYDALRGSLARATQKSPAEPRANGHDGSSTELESMEQSFAMTLMYLLVEMGRQQIKSGQEPKIRDEILVLEPEMLGFFVKIIGKLRWNETPGAPVTKLSQLFWKSMLLSFGDADQLSQVKKALFENSSAGPEKSVITATPLDYHLFRQEITSKYPAYNPPPPILPLELENTSMLPPLTMPSRSSTASGQMSSMGPARFPSTGNSILQQPVHIATPVPSPPPSPAGPGGKAGKKQNYQTNQNFPFLYPPLDASSNGAGGKGGSGLQEMLVGKKWEGSDIPTSILEAGTLFAKRTRMTRSTKQLWDERERYMKFERGWDATARSGSGLDPKELQEVEERLRKLGLEGIGSSDYRQSDEPSKETSKPAPIATHLQRRLDLVDSFYRSSLPHLQSLVIVLLKEILANVTYIANQPGAWGTSGLGPGFQENGGEANGARARPEPNRHSNGGIANGLFRSRQRGLNDVDAIEFNRQREISSKAVSGSLIMLLKWFKISHVLKYEYLTQLLLDSNFLPLILKLFAHQDLDKAIECKIDRQPLGFFAYCQAHSPQQSEDYPNQLEESSEDEAMPPPIRLARNDTQRPPLDTQSKETNEPRRPPEVDELGHPTTELPSTPISLFSWRNFFSSINFLKIMQKIVRHKTHRNLLLVHYKSSTILRKVLKVPQPELRLYALKLFKGQVPYCGRKWRQSNMRVITAVYLHVPPELRDDWLAGGDVDSEVEDALPQEQALRALTHWWHCTRYPEQLGAGGGLLESEVDFFARELDRMDGGVDDTSDDIGREQWEGQVQLDAW